MESENEPLLTTDQTLLGVLDELKRREPIFHRPELGTSRANFEAMTDPDFWEIGASGRCYSRDHVLEVLDHRYGSPHEDPWETSELQCHQLATDLYLLTYTLLQDTRLTRRSTIWRRARAGWRIVFHQGTEVKPA
jgi:hypothetical protein